MKPAPYSPGARQSTRDNLPIDRNGSDTSGITARSHIAGALHVGCTPESVIEVLFLCAVFAGVPAAENAGFPAPPNGVFAAQEVLASRLANSSMV